MANAAIYARLSQDRDGTKGGVERQLKDCRALAKREGLKVVAVYQDDDRSAFSGKPRPEFERMLRELDGFDTIIFWKTDRLVRRFTQFARVLAACETADVRLVSVVDPIDTSTPILKGVAGLMASMGEQESQNISTRVKRFHLDAATKGQPHGHRRAFGYESDGMTVVKREAEAIREARDRILNGETMRSICRDWTARGLLPPTADAWYVTGFKRMLTSGRIAGLSTHQGEVVADAKWPAIISPADRERIRAKLRGVKRGRPAKRLLSGFLRCGLCGGPLHSGVRSDGQHRWQCRKQPGDDSRCGKVYLRSGELEDYITTMALTAIDKPALSAARRKRSTGPQSDPAAQLATLENDLEALATDHGAGLISRREWIAARAGIEPRIEALRAELNRTDDVRALAPLRNVRDAPSAFAKLELGDQRAVLAAVITHVEIAPAKPGMTAFVATRVKIIWKV